MPLRLPRPGTSHVTRHFQRHAFVRFEQSRKLCLLENQPFVEAPGTAAPLVFEVNPRSPRTRMPKGLPKHREIISFRIKTDDMFDTDSLGIAALKPVSEAERATPALLAPAQEKALIPVARRQLIPDKRRYATRLANRQPSRPVSTRSTLPPISGHDPIIRSWPEGKRSARR